MGYIVRSRIIINYNQIRKIHLADKQFRYDWLDLEICYYTALNWQSLIDLRANGIITLTNCKEDISFGLVIGKCNKGNCMFTVEDSNVIKRLQIVRINTHRRNI